MYLVSRITISGVFYGNANHDEKRHHVNHPPPGDALLVEYMWAIPGSGYFEVFTLLAAAAEGNQPKTTDWQKIKLCSTSPPAETYSANKSIYYLDKFRRRDNKF